MPRKFIYTDFPELQVRTLDHTSANIGHDHDRHELFRVKVLCRGWAFERAGEIKVHPDREVDWAGPALVFPAKGSRSQLTFIARILGPPEDLQFTLVGADGEQLEQWSVSTGMVDPFMVCRFDLPNRPYRDRSEPGYHTILRLPPEYLQEGVDPRAVPLYEDMLRMLRRHLEG